MRNLEDWLAYIDGVHWQTMDLGLERMCALVAKLELERPAPIVVTVAGTNGKGSTVRGIEQLLVAAGKTVGATYSPHVHAFSERLRINGEPAADDRIVEAFDAVEKARGDTPLTYFEFAALASLWLFKQTGVDVAVLEIGLGGRLDAFNAVDADVAVITSIGFDHEKFLGSDLDSIGAEKAGILRAGQHVVLGENMPASVYTACREFKLEPLIAGVDFDVSFAADGSRWQLTTTQLSEPVEAPLGSLAPVNLSLAWHAAAYCAPLRAEHLLKANETAALPGRMQTLARAERTWVLDVAHNPAGAGFLADGLALRGLEPALIICGMLRDKHHAQVRACLAERFPRASWWLVDTQGERGMTATELAQACSGWASEVVAWEDVAANAHSATQPGDVILALGSFNVVEQIGAVLEAP